MRININGVIGSIDDLPGSSQVAVSHGVFMPRAQRGQGKGKQAHKERLNFIEELGYDYVICTVDLNNTPQIRILESNNWVCLSSFYSSKTGHRVALYGRTIIHESGV